MSDFAIFRVGTDGLLASGAVVENLNAAFAVINVAAAHIEQPSLALMTR
jgi:hypothetical protein